jgi:phosphoserine phosphatase
MFTNKNPFSDLLWTSIKAGVMEGLKQPGPHYAVFDADGTLWPLDAGETFFKYQIARSDLQNIPKDPWAHYWEMKDYDAPGSCLWLAQINKGKSLAQVRKWADECYQDPTAFPIHQSMHDLVKWLLENRVQVYIVTASIKWAVEPAARRLGLKNENVIGIEVTEKNGLLTDEGIMPLSYGDGKPVVFLNYTKKVRPILAAGNTFSDSYLVDTASHVGLAISSAAQGEHNHETEMKMREHALKKGWLTHSFY